MTASDARTLLIEQGALLIQARLQGTAARADLNAARLAWSAAAETLVEANPALDLPADVQYECFRLSAEKLGLDPDGPELKPEREALQRLVVVGDNQRLIAQYAAAEWN